MSFNESKNATEELRRLLDERGIAYATNYGENVQTTSWPYKGALTATFSEYDGGATRFEIAQWNLAPEQAVAATLGTETLDAVDVVCLHCSYVEPACSFCPVRELADYLNGVDSKPGRFAKIVNSATEPHGWSRHI